MQGLLNQIDYTHILALNFYVKFKNLKVYFYLMIIIKFNVAHNFLLNK